MDHVLASAENLYILVLDTEPSHWIIGGGWAYDIDLVAWITCWIPLKISTFSSWTGRCTVTPVRSAHGLDYVLDPLREYQHSRPGQGGVQ